MNRERITQVLGFTGLFLLAVGAFLYAVNSPQRDLTRNALISGGVAVAVFAGLNASLIRSYFGRRSSRHGANMAAMIILFSCIVVIVQALAVRHTVRYDTTRNKRFTLAGQTLAVLAGLERDLEVFAFFTTGTPERAAAADLLDQYAYHTSGFRYELIDPDQNPGRARAFDVNDFGTTVVRYGDKSEKLSDISEEILTNAILKLSRNEPKLICFVWGHGERDVSQREGSGYSVMIDAIENENYVTRTISLAEEKSVPDDCSVLVIAGPKNDYLAGEIEKIEEYLGAPNG